jgi:anamorsin
MSPSRLAASPRRTLLLAPPSLSAHPAALSAALAAHSQTGSGDSTDMEMLDRVAAGHASLESGAYATVVLLSPEPPQATQQQQLGRTVMAAVADALAPEGRFDAVQGGGLARADRTEGILAGLLVADDGALTKPRPHETVVLRRGDAAAAAVRPVVAGVGFVDFGHGHEEIVTGEDDDEDDELVDEDELLTEEDRTFVQRRWLVVPFRSVFETDVKRQRPSANRSRERGERPARTAPAASRRSWTPRTRSNASTRT